MVDLETTGTNPVHNHIIQIAAVRFDLHEKKIDIENMFDQCLIPKDIYGRHWDEGTQTWWADHPDVLDGICARMQPAKQVLENFQQWVSLIPLQRPVRVWAKPISFEFPFIQSYFAQLDVMSPLHYRYAVDLNSYILGRGHTDIDDYWRGIEPVGDKHNALHDVLYQIRGAFQA